MIRKIETTLLIFIAVYSSVFLMACEKKTEVSSFIIERQGEFYPDEYFGVVEVFGFSDNEAMAKELTDYLKKSEPEGAQRNQHRYRYHLSDRP
jgi:hypothetical protein